MLKKIKNNNGMHDIRHNINMMSMMKAGHLRVVLKKNTKEEESITQVLLQAVGENAESFELKDSSQVLISDIDEDASNEEIISAMVAKLGST
ncbi:Hypothetical protein CINCED_3A025223 [Cinara cedri]|uniref:Uncharacterized protein n=1 Tax=Cinara cedri TaxID=506608 RepID=A0A5E4MR20_9HEMI|nr:Hypothetical protein CINCED_3A025223 [Cinara cedri]